MPAKIIVGADAEEFRGRSFTDVEAEASCAAYVECAVERKLVEAVGEGLFALVDGGLAVDVTP